MATTTLDTTLTDELWELHRTARRIVGPADDVGNDDVIVSGPLLAQLAQQVASVEEQRFRLAQEEIRQAAERIDPYTARMVWWYAQTLDPYGLGYDLSPEEEQVGREYFLEDPERKWPVLVYEVRKLHPEIGDEEWEQLMRAAAKRDDSFDPFPFFHGYRGRS
jgi:hypothetical protein